jgi:hypothetical protein
METRVKLTPNKLKIVCKVDWPAFGLGQPWDGSLGKAVVNEVCKVYRVIEKRKKQKKP